MNIVIHTPYRTMRFTRFQKTEKVEFGLEHTLEVSIMCLLNT
jgi:hypothetical protein